MHVNDPIWETTHVEQKKVLLMSHIDGQQLNIEFRDADRHKMIILKDTYVCSLDSFISLHCLSVLEKLTTTQTWIITQISELK